MAEGDGRPVEVIRYATAGRRQPTYIGTDTAGVKIPGGPYTLLQALGGPLVGLAAWATRNVWAETLGLSFIVSWFIIAAATFAAVWMLGLVDLSDHNPLYSVLGAWRLLNQPGSGRVGGQTLARRPARTVRTGPSALGTLIIASPAAPKASQPASDGTHDGPLVPQPLIAATVIVALAQQMSTLVPFLVTFVVVELVVIAGFTTAPQQHV